jgi:hypothetical protein
LLGQKGIVMKFSNLNYTLQFVYLAGKKRENLTAFANIALRVVCGVVIAPDLIDTIYVVKMGIYAKGVRLCSWNASIAEKKYI